MTKFGQKLDKYKQNLTTNLTKFNIKLFIIYFIYFISLFTKITNL